MSTIETTKKQRAQETIEKLLELLPQSNRLMLMAFLPQFRASFNTLPDEELDKILNTIRGHLDYIENGAEAVE